ncbi:MAG: hypothetical protein ACLKAO_00280 [Alkaliphilus sp.]
MIRRKSRKNKEKWKQIVTVVSLTIMISFAVLGGAYAIWDDQLFIRERGETGSFDIDENGIAVTNEEVEQTVQRLVTEAVYETDDQGVYILDAQGKKILVTPAVYEDVVEHALDGSEVKIYFINNGTVSAKLDEVIVSGNVTNIYFSNLSIEDDENNDGQLDPGETGYVEIYIDNQNLADLGFTVYPIFNWAAKDIEISLEFIQWSEWYGFTGGWSETIDLPVTIEP